MKDASATPSRLIMETGRVLQDALTMTTALVYPPQ